MSARAMAEGGMMTRRAIFTASGALALGAGAALAVPALAAEPVPSPPSGWVDLKSLDSRFWLALAKLGVPRKKSGVMFVLGHRLKD